jgi:hypothetical protein
MWLVHAHVADFMVLAVDDREPARLLEQLHAKILENVGERFRPALVARGRSRVTAQLGLTEPPYSFRRLRLQDRQAGCWQ